MPTAGVSDHCIGAFRSPGACVVFERASRYLQSRFDNAPRRFDLRSVFSPIVGER
jgi:hypothetical protein